VGGRSWMTVGVRRFTPPSCVTGRFGAFAVLTLRAIGQIRRGRGLTAAYC
jgi:hypothetical protein